jgi:hypothetical protein
MTAIPVIRTMGGNYRPFGHCSYIGVAAPRTEAARHCSPGHRAYSGIGPVHTINDMQAAVERRERELRRRALWLDCERAPFNRAHP